MSEATWECNRPNNCTDKCKLRSSIKPTGCVYSDEEDIPRDADIWMQDTLTTPKFKETFCSQCGGSFGPGDHGYSHCEDHSSVSDREPEP